MAAAVPTRVPTRATPPPAESVTVEAQVRVWSRDEIIDELYRYPWPVAGAIATIQCESGFNQFARNRSSGARGLFQDINGDAALDDPRVAIYRGYLKWLDGGGSFWKHWGQWGGCGAGW